MDTWQIDAAKKITDIICGLYEGAKIDFHGSMLDHDLLDVFSDVDMDVFLPDGVEFKINEFIYTLSNKFIIFGYEIYNYENRDLLRICFDEGWRFDISFFYSYKKEIIQEKVL
jgi:hypothetical protein